MSQEIQGDFQREKFVNQDYVDSWTAEGSNGAVPRDARPRGRANTVLAFVHIPTSAFAIGDTLTTTAHLTHVEIAGVAVLFLSALYAASELARSGWDAGMPIVRKLRAALRKG